VEPHATIVDFTMLLLEDQDGHSSADAEQTGPVDASEMHRGNPCMTTSTARLQAGDLAASCAIASNGYWRMLDPAKR
jgi:hypothetical protein